jgi:hypothetical protein
MKYIVVLDGQRYEFNHIKRGTYLIRLLDQEGALGNIKLA